MNMICARKCHFFRKSENFGQTLFNKSVAIAPPLVTVHWKSFQMMPYIIILRVRQFHYPTTSRFGTERQKSMWGEGHNVLPLTSLNSAKLNNGRSKPAVVNIVLNKNMVDK